MPQGVILPGEKEIMQGHKVHLSTHGAGGVACWRVDCSRSVLAVMWSIPLHFSFWTNWMAIGIFPDTMEISQQIFDLMYSRVIRTPVDNLLGYIYDRGMYIGSMYINGF